MNKTKDRKPFDPTLPGPLAGMTLAELDAESSQYDASGVAEAQADAFARSGQPMPPHPKKKPGPKPKAAKDLSDRILVTAPPKLLDLVALMVKRRKMARSTWLHALILQEVARNKTTIGAARVQKAMKEMLAAGHLRSLPRDVLEPLGVSASGTIDLMPKPAAKPAAKLRKAV